MIPRVSFKPAPEAARRLLELLSPPDLPPDPFFLELFEVTVRSRFRAEQNAPKINDEELRKLTAPVCLLMGQYELSFSPYQAIERGLRLLPNVVTAEVVPGVGHAMVHRQADWVIGRVTSFLEKHAV
jgi:pimeloyl-ACP methyl ester carboxylesterase